MSRRIALTLAASVAVIALLAAAGRECFDGRCHLPGLVEHVASVPRPPVLPPSPAREESAVHAAVEPAREAAAPTAVEPVAPAVAVPAAAREAKSASEKSASEESVSERSAREAKPMLANAKLQESVAPQEQVLTRGPRILRVSITSPAAAAELNPAAVAANSARLVHVASTAFPVADQGFVQAEERAAGIAAPVYEADDGVLIAGVGLDPAWKSCQIDDRGYDHDYYLCGPYSYRPYGAYGYRPYGTYAEYRSPPVYMVGPGARIIQVRARN
jgi:hypothetical protein